MFVVDIPLNIYRNADFYFQRPHYTTLQDFILNNNFHNIENVSNYNVITKSRSFTFKSEFDYQLFLLKYC